MVANVSIPTERLLTKLKEQKLDFFVSVPCKLLADLINLIENEPDLIYTPVTREEEGIGVLAGAFLAGKRPAILMQNSGIGNCINAICSLLNYYGMSTVFVISHRGTKGELIEAQKPMGNAAKALLKAANVKTYEISTPEELHIINERISEAYAGERSVAFLFPFSFWK